MAMEILAECSILHWKTLGASRRNLWTRRYRKGQLQRHNASPEGINTSINTNVSIDPSINISINISVNKDISTSIGVVIIDSLADEIT